MFNTHFAAALFLTAIAAQAQTNQWPWQVSVQTTVNSVASGSSRISLDLPLPPAGRILTVEQISVMVGPMSNPYGKVHQCEIESSRPNVVAENADASTRLLLPTPEWLSPSTARTKAIVSTPIRLHVEGSSPGLRNGTFRVSCDAEFVINDRMTVTLVGYTTPKP